MSLQELGAKIGVTGTQLSHLERGKSGLRVKEFLSICEALCIDPQEVFDEGINEYSVTAGALRKLSEREFRIVKDLVTLLSLSTDDL